MQVMINRLSLENLLTRRAKPAQRRRAELTDSSNVSSTTRETVSAQHRETHGDPLSARREVDDSERSAPCSPGAAAPHAAPQPSPPAAAAAAAAAAARAADPRAARATAVSLRVEHL
jgi:hypothetical protein